MNAQITIPRAKLTAALARIVDTAPNRSPKPVLTHCRIQVNGHVSIEATSIDHSQTEILTDCCERRGEADLLVNARDFRKLVTAHKARQLTLSIDDDGIQIGGSRVPSGPSPDELPNCNNPTVDAQITLPAADLQRLIERTVYAVDAESSRYALAAILLETDGIDHLRAVATDGRRLATDYVDTPHVAPEALTTALWLGKFAKQALKAIRKSEECQLGFAENHIVLTCRAKDGTSTTWRYRQVEGIFPKWREVIPELSQVCVADADDLHSACQQIISAPKRDCGECFENSVDVSCADDVLTISARYAESFHALDVSTIGGATTLDICLNAEYVRDFAKSCSGSVLTISARDVAFDNPNDKQGGHPVRIECGNADYIVMPLARN